MDADTGTRHAGQRKINGVLIQNVLVTLLAFNAEF